MSIERVSVRPISFEGIPDEDQQRAIGRRVQELVLNDFLRVGASKRKARSIADPLNEDKVTAQVDRIASAAGHDVIYGGVYQGDNEVPDGVVKIGLWTPGDAEPFGNDELILANIEEAMVDDSRRTRGLHVFAVPPELASPTLRAVHTDRHFIPYKAALNVVAHTDDGPLHEALAERGAPKGGPEVHIRLGGYAAKYSLYKVPPMFSQHVW